MGEGSATDLQRRVGRRLRTIRRQQRLSLQDVEVRSGAEFKASVLGAYERGERAITVARLARLAEVYGVPAEQLLPESTPGSTLTRRPDGRGATIDLRDRGEGGVPAALMIDLARLASLRGPETEALARYVRSVQVERQDFAGRVLTLRHDDRLALAAILGATPERLAARLSELGLAPVPEPAEGTTSMQ